jgi:hypothetical protein
VAHAHSGPPSRVRYMMPRVRMVRSRKAFPRVSMVATLYMLCVLLCDVRERSTISARLGAGG